MIEKTDLFPEKNFPVRERFVNRELSWLQFNARVLQEATDENTPLLERIRFLGIFSNNLDEFFKVRYATIKRIVEAGKTGRSFLGGISAKELLEEITQTVIEQQSYSLLVLNDIHRKLREENIFIINETEVSDSQSEYILNFFHRYVSPALMVLMIGELEKFPDLRDDAVYLAVKMVMSKHDDTFETRNNYALIEIPRTIDRFIVLPSKGSRQYVIMLDDLIRYCLDNIFSFFSYKSISAHMIKITRDAELDIDSDLSRSFIEKISKSVKDRSKGDPVRFVFDQSIDEDILRFLLTKMGINETDSIIPGGRYHNRRDYMKFPSLGRHDLLYKPLEPLPIPGLSTEGRLFDKIFKKDYLLHAPYQNFRYVVRFLREAALDPKVKAIKITIYRLAEISHIAGSLINAKRNGKDVTVQIELQARFDEEANINYAELFQSEDIRLVFGVKGLKVHSKICVIDRIENKKLVRYGIISTGNFNETTARIYTDYTLFTANQEICKELNKIFEFFDVNYKVRKYRHLIVSPHYTRNAIISLIETEIKNKKAGLPSGIKMKLNSLADFKIIDKLYEASRAGVKVKMIVRGICSLIPGVKGMSENIEVISIVGRFLEHPRLFIFKNGGEEKVYISSADMMSRNLDNRVEVSCPVYDEDIKKELLENFEIGWRDNVKARINRKENDNAYRRNDEPPQNSQLIMYEYYLNKLKNN